MSKELVNEALALMSELTPNEREQFIAAFRHEYCWNCGAEDPSCQCWNDE